MSEKNLVKELEKWLKRKGNSYAKAAYLLGYKDGAPVRQWVARKKIPPYQAQNVHQLLEGKLE